METSYSVKVTNSTSTKKESSLGEDLFGDLFETVFKNSDGFFAGYPGRGSIAGSSRGSIFDGSSTPFEELLGFSKYGVEHWDDADQTIIEFPLPGVTKESIAVEILNSIVTVKGTRKLPNGRTKDTVATHTIIASKYQLPENLAARFDNGILTIILPRKKETPPPTTKVTVE